ncbi:MAG TPA: branched-chain amino acid transaminase [Thermodesulfobacteriota bacterium]|nr:branched-chain amino acid transaminase [Thermodesulfobacteriota bacterium]
MGVQAKVVWLDGRLVPWQEAQVHVLTHTLHYGLGVFEGIRAYRCADGGSAVFRLKEHIARLFDSAKICLMRIPFTPEQVERACIETLRANGLRAGYIRPIAFIGDGVMGLHPRDNPVRLAIATWEWGAYLGEEGLKHGIRVKISSFARQHVNTHMNKAKICGQYVNSILAKLEVTQAGYDEALLLDTDGYVAEASGENFFIVTRGRLVTAPLATVLGGITRDSVLTLARDQGIPVEERRLARDEVYIADEAFFTGTAAEVTPIREVDDRPIGTGRPGPITQALQAAFFDVVTGKDARYASWLTRY